MTDIIEFPTQRTKSQPYRIVGVLSFNGMLGPDKRAEVQSYLNTLVDDGDVIIIVDSSTRFEYPKT